MNNGKLVFAQLNEHLPKPIFRDCDKRYAGRFPTLSFSHWGQFLCMVFAQLTSRTSCRNIELCWGLSLAQALAELLGARLLNDKTEGAAAQFLPFPRNLRTVVDLTPIDLPGALATCIELPKGNLVRRVEGRSRPRPVSKKASSAFGLKGVVT